MKQKIAVTGASGHIGNVICRLLVEKGFHVKALYYSDFRSLDVLDVEKVKGNVLIENDLDKLINGCEIVINCAAIVSIYGDPTGLIFKTNTIGAKNVLETCIRKGVKRLIHFSSVHAVVESMQDLPFTENLPYKTKDNDAYDYSKAVGEQLLLNRQPAHPVEIVILRPSAVVGPFDFKPSPMGKALLDFYNQKIPVLAEGGFDFVDVEDVAKTAISAIEKGRSGEIYLLSGKYYSLRELTKIINKITGKNVPKLVIPYVLLKILLPLISFLGKITGKPPLFTKTSIDALKSGHKNMDSSKAKRDLAHTNKPLEESVRNFYEWCKLNKRY